jgi:hypothetical protein
MSWFWEPLAVVGIWTDCTKSPSGSYSSRNTVLPVFTSEPVPVPTR